VLVYRRRVMVRPLLVMMLDINLERLREGFWTYLPLGAAVGILMVVEMGARPGAAISESKRFPARGDLGRAQAHQGTRTGALYPTTPIRSSSPRWLLLVASSSRSR